MKPHAPDPGCDRLKSLLVPARDVKTREILRCHREAQGLPSHAEVISKAKAKASKSSKKPGQKPEERNGKCESESKTKCKKDSIFFADNALVGDARSITAILLSWFHFRGV